MVSETRIRNRRTGWSHREQPALRQLVRGLTGTLPDFIIIGAQRCGTTSLYTCLVQHPCVMSARTKELHFFEQPRIYYQRGVRWYRAQFPSIFRRAFSVSVLRQPFVTGEGTPYYLFHPQVPARVQKVVPRVRLIVLLRNPVDRAYSHYHFSLRKGLEQPDISFEQAVELEASRLEDEQARLEADPLYRSPAFNRHSYLSRGIYVDQLQRWMEYFPREQFLILRSEAFFADPASTLAQVMEFLELPVVEVDTSEPENASDYRAPMAASTRHRLSAYFAPHNRRLYAFLGVDFCWDQETS